MTKEDLEKLEKLSPYSKDNYEYQGWKAVFELHNGNIYTLIFWKGRLFKLNDAQIILNKKYYDKYKGKTLRVYEWTLLKKYLLNHIEYLDKIFKKNIRKTLKEEKK